MLCKSPGAGHILVKKPQCARGRGWVPVNVMPTSENRNGCVDKRINFWGSPFAGPFHFLEFLIKTKIIDEKENNNWPSY